MASWNCKNCGTKVSLEEARKRKYVCPICNKKDPEAKPCATCKKEHPWWDLTACKLTI